MKPISRIGEQLAACVAGWLIGASCAVGAVQIVPGLPSSVEERVDGHLIIDGATADAVSTSWCDCAHLPVGEDWPGPTMPAAGEWTLDVAESVLSLDGVDMTSGRSLADFNFDYDGLTTSVLAASRSEGQTMSQDPGPGDSDSFSDLPVMSRINGRIDMWLTSDAVGDAGIYDVSLLLSISGSDLSVVGDATALMSYFVRVTPADGSGPVEFEGDYSDLVLPPTDPADPSRFLIQESIAISGLEVVDFGQTPVALIELGEGFLVPGPPDPDTGLCPPTIDLTEVGLLTSVEGRTEAPDIFRSAANSLFDATLSLQFDARLVPEPSSLGLLLLGLGTLELAAIGRTGKKRRHP